MTFVIDSGEHIFELWDDTITLEWKEQDFPECDGTKFSVEQDLNIPDSENPLNHIRFLENHVTLMAVLYLVGFEPGAVISNDNVIYWEIDELPWDRNP